MRTDQITPWAYKFVVSERFTTGRWHAISEDDRPIEPKPMAEVLSDLGLDGWELIAVVPVGETALNHDQMLKHIFKRPGI